MKLYDILIVDDEDEIREGIINKINWNKYGFNIIGEAKNGREAIELTESINPDIVMTDIIMPFMNGLELCEYLYRHMPSIKMIIFSGSDDLDYAHKAIKLNVVEYVLKPVSAEDINETLIKLKNTLDEEYKQKRDLERLKEHYYTSLPIIKEQILTALIEGRLKKEQYIKNSEIIGVYESQEYVACLVGTENDFTNMQREIFKENDRVLMNITVKQLLDETLEESYKFTSFLYGNMIALIVSLKDKSDIYSLIDAMEKQVREVNRIYGITITIGIGVICNDLLDIRYSRKEAQTALDYKFSLGSGKVIYIGDVEPDLSINLIFNGQDERDLISAIKISDEKKIEEVAKGIIEKLSKVVGEINKYKMYFMEIKVSLLRLIQNYKLDITRVFEGGGFYEDLFDDNNSLESLEEWLILKSKKISSLIKKDRIKSSTLLIDKVKDYIMENYYDRELTVECICENFHLSAAYFSTIFKKETGVTFISYLTDIRLEKAVELLNTTDYKSYIIADKVGYSEANYFSYVFKKKYGVSPSKFRNNRGEDMDG